MTKKIIYTLVIIVAIILFTIFWRDSNKEPVTPVLPVVVPSTTTQPEEVTPPVQVDTPASINGDLDKMDINSGIDNDLNSMDGDIKTL